MFVLVLVGHCVCPTQTNSTENTCRGSSESSFENQLLSFFLSLSFSWMHHWEIWWTSWETANVICCSSRSSSHTMPTKKKKNPPPECLHTSTGLRLIIQINMSLFIKWNLSLFRANRGVCMPSPRCKTHIDTDAHTESANEQEVCFLAPRWCLNK